MPVAALYSQLYRLDHIEMIRGLAATGGDGIYIDDAARPREALHRACPRARAP